MVEQCQERVTASTSCGGSVGGRAVRPPRHQQGVRVGLHLFDQGPHPSCVRCPIRLTHQVGPSSGPTDARKPAKPRQYQTRLYATHGPVCYGPASWQTWARQCARVRDEMGEREASPTYSHHPCLRRLALACWLRSVGQHCLAAVSCSPTAHRPPAQQPEGAHRLHKESVATLPPSSLLQYLRRPRSRSALLLLPCKAEDESGGSRGIGLLGAG